MALILEQLDARRAHVVRRFPLDGAGLSLGRAADCGAVIDDPHVDAVHARVVPAEDGTFVLEDAGSVNGIDVVHGGRTTRLALTGGVEFRLGRTSFRVADTTVLLPAALPLAVAPSGALPWYERQSYQMVMPVVLALITGLQAYFDTSTRDAGSTALSLVVGVMVVTAIWAGVWALVGRGLVRRAAFLSHAAILAASLGFIFVAGRVFRWAVFLYPAAAETWNSSSSFLTGALLIVATVRQLGLATSLSERRRWIGALAACGFIAVLVGAFALVEDDAFTDVPEFEATLRHAPTAIIPATDADGFRAAISELRADVDSLRTREAALSGR